jgi:hypothetical protein
MKQLRRLTLVMLALALCATPAALAKDKQKGELVPVQHRVAGMTGGELLGEGWADFLTAPAGTFSGGCMPVAHKVVSAEVDADGNASCTLRKGTTIMLFLGSECSNVEEEPFFGADARQQRECAIEADQFFVSALVSLDGGAPVQQVAPRFEEISPQRSIELPPDNVLGVDPGPATFVAHGWVVLVQKLDPGEHLLTGSVTTADGITTPFRIAITVVK